LFVLACEFHHIGSFLRTTLSIFIDAYCSVIRLCSLFILIVLRTRGVLSANKLFAPLASLEKMGALDWAKVVHQHQAWRLISCIWLHAGLIHLIVNMLSLLFIGLRLEQQFGFGKLLQVQNRSFLPSAQHTVSV
jgi:membrane associated rhomboid family serine protease